MGGKFLLKLNNGERPIANKYREGKMQRTLKRELKVLEIVKREAIGSSTMLAVNSFDRWWNWYGVDEWSIRGHRSIVSWSCYRWSILVSK